MATNHFTAPGAQNFTSQAVMECLGSALTNKYSEGLPGARYYGGNQFIDKVRQEEYAFSAPSLQAPLFALTG